MRERTPEQRRRYDRVKWAATCARVIHFETPEAPPLIIPGKATLRERMWMKFYELRAAVAGAWGRWRLR